MPAPFDPAQPFARVPGLDDEVVHDEVVHGEAVRRRADSRGHRLFEVGAKPVRRSYVAAGPDLGGDAGHHAENQAVVAQMTAHRLALFGQVPAVRFQASQPSWHEVEP